MHEFSVYSGIMKTTCVHLKMHWDSCLEWKRVKTLLGEFQKLIKVPLPHLYDQ